VQVVLVKINTLKIINISYLHDLFYYLYLLFLTDKRVNLFKNP